MADWRSRFQALRELLTGIAGYLPPCHQGCPPIPVRARWRSERDLLLGSRQFYFDLATFASWHGAKPDGDHFNGCFEEGYLDCLCDTGPWRTPS
jgi:hypothetical protein